MNKNYKETAEPTGAEQYFSAAEIAEKLPADQWRPEARGFAHLGPQQRLELILTANHSLKGLAYESRSFTEDSDAFAQDVLAVIGRHLPPALEMSLVRALFHSLADWQKQRALPEEIDEVGDLLRELLTVDRSPMAQK